MKKVFFVVLLVMFAGINLRAETIVFQDNFTRADSNDLGSPWEESGPATSTRILSDELRVQRTATYLETGYARISGMEQWVDFDVTFQYKGISDANTSSWVKFCVAEESTGWNQDGWALASSAGTGLSAYVSMTQWISGATVIKNQAFCKLDEWANITLSVRGNEATITAVSPSRGTMTYSLPEGTLNRNYENAQYFAIVTFHPASSQYDAAIDDLTITGITPVPEPATIGLLTLGAMGLWIKKRK